MADRKYRPGQRIKRYTEGRISEHRLAWLQTYVGQFVLMFYNKPQDLPDTEETVQEPGPTLRLMLPTQRGRATFYNITALTHEELVELKKLFDMMFELAEPIVIERDKEAQDAYERGDDSFTRIYRPVPRLVVRTRPFGADGEGVRERPDDDGQGDGRRESDELPEDRNEVADGEQEDRRPQDDVTSPDEPADVR